MNAAIYARKSTAQDGVADEQKSVTRQTELARAFAVSQGWSVVAEFSDDGVSGAEFANRPGYQRLMRALIPRPTFGVLNVSEQTSLGREVYETQYAIKQFSQAGVQVWSYMKEGCLTPKNAREKAMSGLDAFGDEAHREDTAARTHESHAQLARNGHVTGGRVFWLSEQGRDRRSRRPRPTAAQPRRT